MNDKVVLIIADDTTGANASGVLLKELGMDVYNALNEESLQTHYNALTIGTGTRSLSSNTAAQRITNLLNHYQGIPFMIYSKRIDSTLRGNIGSELEAFEKHFKKQRKCIIVAAFPKSQRICAAGTLYVNDTLLEKTEIAQDPKQPIQTSYVIDLFQKDSNLIYDSLYISSLRQGDAIFKQNLIAKLETCDALIIDAICNEDIDFIARNINNLQIDIICVDPGPFTQRMTYYALQKTKHLSHNLFVIGSVVDTTIMQLKYINELSNFTLIYVNPEQFFVSDYTDCIESITNNIPNITTKNIVISTINIANPIRIDLVSKAIALNKSVDDISEHINKGLALLTLTIINNSCKEINNLYCCGGDVSLAILKEAHVNGLNLIKEISPLCVHSLIDGGPLNMMNLITKGGAIGNAFTLELIANYMEEI